MPNPREDQSMRSDPSLLAVLSVVCLVGMSSESCTKKEPKPEPPLVSPQPVQRPIRLPRAVPQKKEMAELLKSTEEMRRRALGQMPMNAPAQMMLRINETLPSKQYPDSYKKLLLVLDERLRAIADGADTVSDYNAMVSACTSCHQVYAPHMVGGMLSLEIR